ncbi:MAG: quinone oxidoreductase [Pseudomonadota bacterium]
MAGAIVIGEHGGPETLKWRNWDLPDLGPDDVRIRNTAIGLNFIDVYHRTGLYPVPLPAVIGLESAGVVETVGENVGDFTPGDRVATATGGLGAYAEIRNAPAASLVKLPEHISDEIAAAALLKGMTAHMLIKSVYPVKAGQTIVVHAAAGGVGLILCQWASGLGARVIGVAGTEEKAALARAHGCEAVIVRSETVNIAEQVKALTDGLGAPVVYDSVGAATFTASLDSLCPRGMLVSYGNASGPPPKLDLLDLSTRGSLFATRPTLFTYVSAAEDLKAAADDLFAEIGAGRVKINIDQRHSLKDAARAHRDLEARKTTGATILLP